MAFPWVWENNFEAGAHGATASSGTLIDFPHFSILANTNMAPYRGAYALRVIAAGGTTSQFIREDTAFDDWVDDITRYVSFYFYLGKNLAMAANDKFSLFEAESTLNTTTEVAAGIQRTSGNIEFWWNETQAAASPSTIVLGTTTSALGRWYHAEIVGLIDTAGAGTIDGYINGVVGTQITTLTGAAIVDAKFGVIGPDAGTSGTVLIDAITYDDARIYPHKERFPNLLTLTQSGHVFVGPGDVASAALLTTGASNIMRLWDTDVANTDDTQGFVAELDLSAFTSVEGPIHFERGCYVTLSGTNPRGQVMLVTNSDTPGVVGPLYYSERGMIHYGQKRKGKGYGI